MSGFAFRLMTTDDIQEYKTWFQDPVLAKRISAPDDQWVAYVQQGTTSKAWAVLKSEKMAAHIQSEYYEGAICSMSIVVNPLLRKNGLSVPIVTQFVEQHLASQKTVLAYIESDNTPSRRCFERAGFHQTAEADTDGMVKYELSPGLTEKNP